MRLSQQISFLLFSLVIYTSNAFAINIPREQFPIENYAQSAKRYISSENSNYHENLLTPAYQTLRLKQFYRHYYASDSSGLSPWSEAMVNAVLPHVQSVERDVLESFNNQSQDNQHQHYGENFKRHDLIWWHGIQSNLNLEALSHAYFNDRNRAIIVNNTAARALPDTAPDFFSEEIAGQGFPFDNLQVASLWVGTPVYVLNHSVDKAWSLVLTPDAYFAWVKSSDIARVSPAFIQTWQDAAKKQLVAITKTETSVLDKQQNFHFLGYIGAVFPLAVQNTEETHILIPVKNTQNQAVIKTGVMHTRAAALMPLKASPEQMTHLIQALQHRAYGWGGAFFFNDCSQELKSLFTPFGIWLPRQSSMQQALNKTIDLSSGSLDKRLALLKSEGHPLMTLIYKKGHIMLYVGQAEINHRLEAMTYQNVWSLYPKNKSTRYVIGGSVFLPMLKVFPETLEVNSQANESVFKLIQLDQFDEDMAAQASPEAFAAQFLFKN